MSLNQEEATLGKRQAGAKAQVPPKEAKTSENPQDGEEDVDENGQPINWRYLEHHGFLFPKDYEVKGISVHYQGEEIALSHLQEELAYYWCQSLETEWETKPEYRKNFIDKFSKEFCNSISYDLDKFDFKNMLNWIAKEKAEKAEKALKRKSWTLEQKLAEKKEREERDRTFGYAIVDDLREKVGGYMIEPPTLFRGRGVHPKSGTYKPRVYPEDITINIAEDAPVPRCTMDGRAWKSIVHNRNVTWLAFYKDEAINNTFKYFFLSANSKLKGLNDMKKYEKARKLKNEIERIRNDYLKKVTSTDIQDRQIGTVAYLIDTLALRVGNEKNTSNEADTVGCCSLRKEHIKLHPDNYVEFDFPGKDSMQYKNTVQVRKEVFENLQHFLKLDQSNSALFNEINPSSLNNYFSSLMEGLTAKVFRTYNASFTLDNLLNNTEIDQGLTEDEKVKNYNEANKQVAILCNHQKTVNKDFDLKIEKQSQRIQEMEAYTDELEQHLKLLKKGKKGFESKEEIDENSAAKLKKVFPLTLDSTRSAIERMESRVRKEKLKLDEREGTKNFSLGTSKINYNDPRITVSWCKRNNVQIEKVFSKELRSKFAWAMSEKPCWRF